MLLVGDLQRVRHSQKGPTHPLQSPCAHCALRTARASPQPEGPAAWLGPPGAASPAGARDRRGIWCLMAGRLIRAARYAPFFGATASIASFKGGL